MGVDAAVDQRSDASCGSAGIPPRQGLLRALRGVGRMRSLGCLLALSLAPACSKKLTNNGSAMDVIAYDLLGMERSTAEYYQIVLDAHDHKTFCYRCTGDPYIADKSLDAIVHLGDATYSRLEGEVQVILLLSDVLVEDKIALARDTAAGSLTKLALKLPEAPGRTVPESGVRYLALLKELDAMHDESGRLRQETPANRQRVARIADEIGSFEFPSLLLAKDGLRFFPAPAYVTQATDPLLREAFDRAMVRRSRAAIFASLQGGIADPAPHVRSACLKGLAALHYGKALDVVVDRLRAENDPWVRATAAEYLGTIGGPQAAAALVPLLHDDDGGVRHRARLELTRLSGRDLGGEETAWEAWRSRSFPAAAPPPPEAPAGGGRR